MIELVAVPAVVSGAVYLKYKLNNRYDESKKILKIFSRCGCYEVEGTNLKNRQIDSVKLKIKTAHKWGMEYGFQLPLGLSFDEVLHKSYGALQDGLNKEIEMEFNRRNKLLTLRAMNGQLPTRVPFRCNTEQLVRDWSVPIGRTQIEEVSIDFSKSCHLLVGGLTRYGKTVLLQHLLYSLTLKNPEHVKFIFIDMKGGLSFARFEELKQVESITHNEDDVLDILKNLKDEIEERLHDFRMNRWENTKQAGIHDRTFIVVDEAAELVPTGRGNQTKKEIMKHLEYIARVSGGLGYNLIWTTQYPTADACPRQIKQNCDTQIAFRVATNTASRVILDTDGAEDIPKIPGRAIIKTDDMKTIQVYYTDTEDIEDALSKYKVVKTIESTSSEVSRKEVPDFEFGG